MKGLNLFHIHFKRVDAVCTLHRSTNVLLLAIVTEVDLGVCGHILHTDTESRHLEVLALLRCRRSGSPSTRVVERCVCGGESTATIGGEVGLLANLCSVSSDVHIEHLRTVSSSRGVDYIVISNGEHVLSLFEVKLCFKGCITADSVSNLCIVVEELSSCEVLAPPCELGCLSLCPELVVFCLFEIPLISDETVNHILHRT